MSVAGTFRASLLEPGATLLGAHGLDLLGHVGRQAGQEGGATILATTTATTSSSTRATRTIGAGRRRGVGNTSTTCRRRSSCNRLGCGG
jgi:hypothetical protein